MVSSPMNSDCIIRPELCEAHLGKGRDVAWEEKNHLVPHTVYLALSSGIKVGVTRNEQIPTRWIDQGATAAIRLAQVPNRFLAGKIEVSLKKHISDKTAWQRMLKNEVDHGQNLFDVKSRMADLMDEELVTYLTNDDDIMSFEYPVLKYPQKVKSVNFDNNAIFEGQLQGIKGQYLILTDDRVINIRRHGGYYIIFNT
jgi:hypothetical protein